MIPPDAQRMMSKRAGSIVVEAKGSHAIYVSQPQVVAKLIETAATDAAQSPTRNSNGFVFPRNPSHKEESEGQLEPCE